MAHHWQRKPNRAGESALYEVITVREAADIWGRWPETIRLAIDAQQLAYRQTATGFYLISLQSMIEKYGNPPKAPPLAPTD